MLRDPEVAAALPRDMGSCGAAIKLQGVREARRLNALKGGCWDNNGLFCFCFFVFLFPLNHTLGLRGVTRLIFLPPLSVADCHPATASLLVLRSTTLRFGL